MPTAVSDLPDFARTLERLDAEARPQALAKAHADYDAHHLAWQILLDGFEGSGGFLDGNYLWPYPREDEPQFRERKAAARYHNYLESLVDMYVRYVFGAGIKRTSKDPAFNQWLEDVDGAGAPMTELMKRFAAMALNGGHAGVLVDKTQEEPTGPRLADEQAQVFCTVFPNVSVVDWRHERNRLVGVKLLETAPPVPLVADDEDAPTQQWLLWSLEGWARYTAEGELLGGAETDLGLVPLVVLRPKPSHVSPMLGRPLCGNANVIRAMFNRASEEDQVLRDQAFSVATVNVPPEGDVDQVKSALGSVIGTAKCVVVKGQLTYQTPSMEVPEAIRANIGYLVQELYRAAHVRFNRDSLDAESAEAIRLQHKELNEMLQGLGKALAQAERDIARAYYAWTEPSPEAAETAFERADPRAEYPTEFFVAELAADLEAWQQAIEMDLGLTMTKRIKKRAVRRIEPDMDPEDLDVVDAEIDEQDEAALRPLPTDTGNPEVDMAQARGGQPRMPMAREGRP